MPQTTVGRYQSIAVTADKIDVSAYNSTFGDLAFTEMSMPSNQSTWLPVDGLPTGDPDAMDPSAYRSRVMPMPPMMWVDFLLQS